MSLSSLFTSDLVHFNGFPARPQDGYKWIDAIAVGDVVASIDEKSGQVRWRKVISTFNRLAPETIALTLEDGQGHRETINTTAEHPFHVQGWNGKVDGKTAASGAAAGQASVRTEWLFPSAGTTQFGAWVKAGALKAGDTVSTAASIEARAKPPAALLTGGNQAPAAANDNTLRVVDIIHNQQPTRVFNFEVESREGEITNNYMVGEDGAWVHNAKKPYSFGSLRRAYEEACAKIGGCKGLPKFKGKWKSPSRGDDECGIRLDPSDDRRGPHLNWWDFRILKRKRGGPQGHIDL